MEVIEKIQEEIQHLPEHLVQEVLYFIQYLEIKHAIKSPDIENLRASQQLSLHKL